MAYSKEFKHSILMKLMPPNNQSVIEIARETGLGKSTLFMWMKEAKMKGMPVVSNKPEPEHWSTKDKFLIVVETASLTETELAQYCRSKGLYVEQVQAWRDACMQANGGLAQETKRLQRELRDKERDNKKLQQELRRKEAALAETAALLVLRKKANAIWGDSEDA
jgi:transposase